MDLLTKADPPSGVECGLASIRNLETPMLVVYLLTGEMGGTRTVAITSVAMKFIKHRRLQVDTQGQYQTIYLQPINNYFVTY